jgi:nitrate reductase NapAB chaperone NapD
VTKKTYLHVCSLGVKTKFETLQTVEETLLANTKTKEKNAPSN